MAWRSRLPNCSGRNALLQSDRDTWWDEIRLEMRSGDGGGEMRGGSWDGFRPSAEGEDAQHQRRNQQQPSDQRADTKIISRRGWSRSELYLTMAILEIRQRQQRRFVVRLGNWIFGEGKEGENVDKVGCGV